MEPCTDLRLHGIQRVFYFFAPLWGMVFTALLTYGAGISSWRYKFEGHSVGDAKMLVMCIVFAIVFMVFTAICYYILKRQLRFTVIRTSRVAKQNFKKVMVAIGSEGWAVENVASTANGIVCVTSDSSRTVGSVVTVLFFEQNVLINSIVNPMGWWPGTIRSQARNIKIVSDSVA